jgi:hypothetical protein
MKVEIHVPTVFKNYFVVTVVMTAEPKWSVNGTLSTLDSPRCDFALLGQRDYFY